MQSDQEELSLHSYYVEEDELDESVTKTSFEFNEKLTIAGEDYEEDETESDDTDNDDEDDYDGENEEFSFASVSDDVLSTAADEVFHDGQIRPIFPLFNQNLLLGDDAGIDKLPTLPSVDNIFVESPGRPSISSENEEIEGIAAGPYCTWTKGASPEFDKKSNSTGFSKLWRFKEKMNRSHSDGRDAFVFLNKSTATTSTKSVVKSDKSPEKKSSAGGELPEKVKSKKGGKKKVTSLSPHEVYLKSKLTEEERRRSYLPYRPELMGFFTNVHGGGLTRNVHPF